MLGLRPEEKYGLAVDVGCGTGLSTLALTTLAERVIGIDASKSMLAEATLDSRVEYICAHAEAIPLATGCAHLISAGSAFHWFDQPRFLAEGARILGPRGVLAVYSDWFSAKMTGSERFESWYVETHSRRYRQPPRGMFFPDDGDATRAGLTPVGRFEFAHNQVYSVDDLVAYLTTQSNVGAAVEAGGDMEGITTAIRAEVAPFFRKPVESFAFTGSLAVFRRSSASVS